MREEVYRRERVTYCEQGVALLENFSMAIWTGEILGLVPANHFGLSALLRLLRQNLPLHYGFVYYKETDKALHGRHRYGDTRRCLYRRPQYI